MLHATALAHAPCGEAEDLVQEALLIAWRELESLRQEDHVGAWLQGIVRQLARRVRERRPSEALPEEELAAREEAHDESAAILAILHELPETYREALAMRLVEGLTGPAIARATGLTEGSVRVHLSRGMKLLRERLSARLGADLPLPRGTRKPGGRS